MRNLKPLASVIALLVVASGAAAQDQEELDHRRDRPGAPIDPRVILVGPTEVDIVFTNTATEGVIFQIEVTLDGKRVHPDFERRISQNVLRAHGVGESRTRVTRDLLGGHLGPGSNFCFRAWSRTRSLTRKNYFESDDVQSPHPSPWACGVLLPNKPPFPQEVTTLFKSCAIDESVGKPCRPGFKDRTVVVRWLVPALPFGTTIDRVVVERKRYLPDATPWEVDYRKDWVIRHALTYPTRDGEFIPPPKQPGSYQYRVCLENAAGRECGVAVTSLTLENPAIQGVARTPGVAVPEQATSIATATAHELDNPNLTRAREAGNTRSPPPPPPSVNPNARLGDNVQLNPQPLPPKTVVLPPKQATVMSGGTTAQTTVAASSAARGQIQGTASGIGATAITRATGPDAMGGSGTTQLPFDGSDLICRGDDTAPAVGPSYTKTPDGADLLMMYFTPAPDGARVDGLGLAPGKCAFIDRALPDAGASIVYFKPADASDEGVRQHLANPGNYWRFRVQKNASGYYEASENAAWSPSPAASTEQPPNLLETDDRTVVSLDGQKMTAGDAKRLVQSDLRQLSRPARPISLARAAPPPLPNANTPLNEAPRMFSAGGASIQGVGAGAGRAAALTMDCVSNPPRISNIQQRITPGGRFTINGSCFGTQPGYVEIIGSFTGGNIRPTFAQWTESTIVAEMPTHADVPSHTISVSVRRGTDARQSPPKQAQFSATLHVVEVASDAWSPSGNFLKHDVVATRGGLMGPSSSFSAKAERRSETFRLAVNPSCALETLDVPATIGQVNAINGWERGPAHEANIEVVWTPACRIHTFDLYAIATHEKHCMGMFELKARASCPTGVAPR